MQIVDNTLAVRFMVIVLRLLLRIRLGGDYTPIDRAVEKATENLIEDLVK